jgi:hypothetical protein
MIKRYAQQSIFQLDGLLYGSNNAIMLDHKSYPFKLNPNLSWLFDLYFSLSYSTNYWTAINVNSTIIMKLVYPPYWHKSTHISSDQDC